MTMVIRPFKKEDEQAVIHLWQCCGLLAPQNDPQKDIERKLQVNPELFLIGKINGQVIASAMGGYEGHRGWINYLAVSSEHRRKGYAKQLVEAIEHLVKERGGPKINLMVRSGNLAVIQFYESLGYTVDEVVGLGKRLIHD